MRTNPGPNVIRKLTPDYSCQLSYEMLELKPRRQQPKRRPNCTVFAIGRVPVTTDYKFVRYISQKQALMMEICGSMAV
jgi:hypothetical protein